MSSSNYTRIENTVVSGSQLLGSLSGDDVKALNFQAALSRNDPIVLSTANYTLTVDDFVQAAVSKQMVDARNIDANRSLFVGTDTQSQAASYVELFNLSSGEQSKVLLEFQLAGADVTSGDVLLANSSGTHNWVNIFTEGGSEGSSHPLFDESTGLAAGSRGVVEVWASNTTAGSEVVNFNVGLASNP